MGCTQSKIENEEAVSRCKDRKQFMKEAATARNYFAAAHSAYTMSLKNTGAALSDYAHGEVANPQQVTHSQSLPASLTGVTQPPLDPLLPPPPPPSLSTNPAPAPAPAPIQRAFSMPEIKLSKNREMENGVGPIIEEENDEEEEMENQEKLTRKRSSKSNRRSSEDQKPSAAPASPEPVPPSVDMQSHPAYDFFFPSVDNIPGSTLEFKMDHKDQIETEREVVDEIPKREEEYVAEQVRASPQPQPPPPPPPPPTMEEEKVAAPPWAAGGGGGSLGRNSKKGNNGVSGSGMGGEKMQKRAVNLLLIFTDLDDHFLKASESAQEVNKMLEATRLHYHSNFADNKGHIDHSARVMRVITWNRSFRGGLNVDDSKDEFDSEENETHATVLDKLVAWEKKLYDEVKAGELMKLDYQKKVAMLNKAKKRDTNSESLEKIKATVSHLHTRYIVDMQSMDSTVAEINRLRDGQLYPKLVQLVNGMATMWETMRHHHDQQFQISLALKDVDSSQCPKETTDQHHQRTIQLWAVVKEWHTQFRKLIDHQKEYIKALKNWLRLNLVPIESNLKEKVSSPARVKSPPIERLLVIWHDYLEKFPDEVAQSAIVSFAAVVQTIVHQQEDELKLKLKCEETQKELSKKTRMFEDWYRKYMQKRTQEELETDESTVKDAVAERQFQVEVVKQRLEEEENAYQKQCIQVRERSLTSLKNHLPEIFRVMRDIAHASSEMYGDLRNRS